MGVRVVAAGPGGDHKAPKTVEVRRPAGVLPEGRLRRCGAGDDVLAVYEAWWAGLPAEVRVDRMSAFSDPELADQVVAVPALGIMSTAKTVEWVQGHRGVAQRRQAAGIAREAENLRDRPRAGLLGQLSVVEDPVDGVSSGR